jgi:predicted PurR-regulated permease PerM
VFVAVLAYHFVNRIAHALILIFAAAFLAVALNPAVGMIRRHLKVKSRGAATASAYLIVVAVIAAFFTFITPPLVRQTRDFIKDIPDTVQNFQSQNSSLSRLAKRYNLDQKLTDGAKKFATKHANFGSTILDTGKRVAEFIVSVLVVLVLAFMMLVEGPQWIKRFFSYGPQKNRARYQRIGQRMYKAITGFVNGQVILAIVAGFFALIALEIASHIMHVNINPIALAGIVSVFGIIPLFGNPIAATLVCLACLLSSWKLALVMAIYFMIYFFIENHTFQPYIQSRLNELTPLTVLVAALVGVTFGGFMGAIIAIPAATTIKIFIEEYYDHHHGSVTSTGS